MSRWLPNAAALCGTICLVALFCLSSAACTLTTPRQGGVRVISSVPDAVLYVDERLKGPVRTFEKRYVYLEPGTHRLMLEHPDHFSELVEIEIQPNMAMAVRVEMRRRPE